MHNIDHNYKWLPTNFKMADFDSKLWGRIAILIHTEMQIILFEKEVWRYIL